MHVDLPLDKKRLENQDWACGLPCCHDLWVAGPLWAAGRWAASCWARGPAFSKTFELGGVTMLVVVMWFEFCNQCQVVVGLKENKSSLGSCFNVTFAECTLMAIRKKPPKNYMCTVWLKNCVSIY